ncbi:AI-2E family transporter [Ruminococcus sp. Marseille-P6503]|uniref:AI-2E family transporter n=1 Tax=Ruminococcus sp. Marseille-P6503 TaxID=2364796 RepID=UPI000F5460BA|nr:AI-2E family transporter [Ruminococcus sp. Marseille-P6503]
MKLYTNKRYNTIALYAVLVIAINVLIVVAVFKFGTIMKILSALIRVLMPLIWGLAIAFLMNPIMVKLESLFTKRVAKKPVRKKTLRFASVTVSSIVFLGIVAGIIAVIVPEFINSFNEIINNFSGFATNTQKWINKLLKNYPQIESFISEKLVDFGTDLTKLQPMLENILSGAWGFVTLVKNFLLGFIVSVYLLFSKETLIAQTKKILFALFKKPFSEKILRLSSQANRVFSSFLTGKIIDSLIIGILCFIGLTIIDMPYNVLISVIVGVTNVIPFFGPFIGAVPSALLILFVEPRKTIWFLLFILILQQFDGNILGPKILGGSTGLPAFWVMISLFVGGGLFGFVGMILAVPTFALIYSLTRESVEARLRKKKLPVSTQYYVENPDKLYASKREKKAPLTPEQLEKIVIPSADEVNEAVLDHDETENEES